MVACASVSHAFSWGYRATAPRFSPSICNLLSFYCLYALCLFWKIELKQFQKASHFPLTIHFVWCIIYTIRLVGWLFDTEKRNEKRKGSVSGAFYLIHLFTLFRAPHSNTRRIDRCKGRAGLTACSFLLQNKEPSLFYYSTPSIFFQYNSKNRSEFLVPNYVLPYESTFLPSGCTSMAHNTAYWYGKQCKELRQLLFP